MGDSLSYLDDPLIIFNNNLRSGVLFLKRRGKYIRLIYLFNQPLTKVWSNCQLAFTGSQTANVQFACKFRHVEL